MSLLLRAGRTTEIYNTGNSKLPNMISKQASAFAYSSTASQKILERHQSNRTTAASVRKVSPGTDNNRGVVIERTSSYEAMGIKTSLRGKEYGAKTPNSKFRGKIKANYSQTRIGGNRRDTSGSPKQRARPQSSGVHLSKNRAFNTNRTQASNNQLLFNTKIMSKANYVSSSNFAKLADGDQANQTIRLTPNRPKSSVPGVGT